MAGISSKAALSSLSAYKYNAGSELEDEGGLNYYNTFFRKYDAQIGRFTGVDMYAGKFAGLNPYQYGANNPIMFNDPMGDKFGGANGERLSQMNANPMGAEFGWSYDFGEGNGGGGGGGSHSGFGGNGFNASGAAAQQLFTALRNAYNNPNQSGEWSFSVGTDNSGNAGFWQPFEIEGGNPAGNGLLSEARVGTRFVNIDGGNTQVKYLPFTAQEFGQVYNDGFRYEQYAPFDRTRYRNQCALRVTKAFADLNFRVSQVDKKLKTHKYKNKNLQIGASQLSNDLTGAGYLAFSWRDSDVDNDYGSGTELLQALSEGGISALVFLHTPGNDHFEFVMNGVPQSPNTHLFGTATMYSVFLFKDHKY